jgi:hypothetical protein
MSVCAVHTGRLAGRNTLSVPNVLDCTRCQGTNFHEAEDNCPETAVETGENPALHLIISLKKQAIFRINFTIERTVKTGGARWRQSVMIGQERVQHRCHQFNRCPLYPRKRTCAVHLLMSALGQLRTFISVGDRPLRA